LPTHLTHDEQLPKYNATAAVSYALRMAAVVDLRTLDSIAVDPNAPKN
jgi:hypothetical protein